MSNLVNFTAARKVKQLEASAPSNSQSKAFVGGKYDEKMTTTEIAKAIRGDIKAAIASGKLPQMKVSVRKTSYQSISIRIEAASFRVMAAERVIAEAANPSVYLNDAHYPRYTEQATQVLRDLEAIASAYNFDNSDSQVDYFHTNFYCHAQYDSAVAQADRDAILAEAAAQVQEAAPAAEAAEHTEEVAADFAEGPGLAPELATAGAVEDPIPAAFCGATIDEMEANARCGGCYNTASALAVQRAIWSTTTDEWARIRAWSTVISLPDPDDRDLTMAEAAIILRAGAAQLAEEAKLRERLAAS